MEPKNNLHLTTQNNNNTASFLANSTGGGSEPNGTDIFSTLCNLATTTNSGFNPQSHLLFPHISNEWNNNSNNWLDQAKLSLFPMYGLLQASSNNTSEFSHNSLPERNFHQTNNNCNISAPPFNIVENLQSSFGLLYNNNNMTNLTNPLQSPLGMLHQSPHTKINMSTYSTASDSDCTLHSNPPSSNLSQLIISPTQPVVEDHQTSLNNHSSHPPVEAIDEFMFDLQDFEELLMEQPSTSFQHRVVEPSMPFSQNSDCSISNKTEHISSTITSGNLNNLNIYKSHQEELANADKEVDRLVSMVAHKNNICRDKDTTTTTNSSSLQQHSISSLFASLNCPPSTSSAVQPKLSSKLEVPQFTPPDSPSPTSTTIAFNDQPPWNCLNDNHHPQQLTTTNDQNKLENSRHSSFGSSTSSTAILPNISTPLKELGSSPLGNLLIFPSKTTTINNKKSSISLIPNEASQSQVDPLRLSKLAMSRKNSDKRIPIYKRGATFVSSSRSSFIESCLKNEPAAQNEHSTLTTEDAFNFDEDFDDKSTDHINNDIIPLKSPQQNFQSQQTDKRLGEHTQEKVKRKYTKRRSFVEETPNNIVKDVEHKPKVRPLLAEQIRMRRPIGTFLNAEIARDDNAAICEVPAAVCTLKNSDNIPSNDSDLKPLPKLVIRILRRTESTTTDALPTPELNEDYNQFNKHNKKKKHHHKKHKKEKDVDWTETDECSKTIKIKGTHNKDKKQHREHKKKRRDSKGSIGSLDNFESNNKNVQFTPSQIRRDSFSPEIFSGVLIDQKQQLNKEEDENNFIERLHYFERPMENPRKGTFLLSKEDLFKPDCALWRIDNQNLLQKYIPFIQEDGEHKGEIFYKNSQTYSGWSPDFVDNHVVVRVEYIKKSRSDNIVRPLLPLQDLFPVVCSSINGYDDKCIVKVSKSEPVKQCKLNSKEHQIVEHLRTFVEIMLRHSITLQFVQNIKDKNDWNYLCAMTEIETQIKNNLKIICSENPRWLPSFLEALHNFPNIFFLRDFDLEHKEEHQSCQACLLKCLDINQAIQLYTEEVYDTETIVPKILNCQNTVCNIDFYLCNRCATAALKYHKIYHLKYSIFKASELKLELTSTENPEYSVDHVIERCKNDSDWVENICNDGANVLLSKQ